MSATLFQLLVLAPIVVVCAAWILWPLIRGARRDARPDDAGHALNLSIVRERRAQLDAELAGLAPDSPERARRILEFTTAAMSDLDADRPDPGTRARPQGRVRTVAAMLVGLVLLAGPLALYRMTGTPEWVEVASSLPADPGNVEGLVAELERRLQTQPDRADGWLLLGRTRFSMGQIDAARAAMEKALEVDSTDASLAAEIRVDLAELLAQAAGNRLDGRPWTLLQQALAKAPQHPKALALAGAYQVSRGDAEAALAYWKPLLALLPAGSEQAAQVQSMIDDLQSGRLSQAPASAPPAGAPVLEGTVSLDPGLAGSFEPDDTLFVVARAIDADGRPVGPPLAVRRDRAAGLPFDFSLSDADAMAPVARLSGHARVVVVARISRSGAATPAPGDLEGRSAPVDANAKGLALRIDRVVR